MPVNEELQALAGLDAADEVGQVGSLGGIRGGSSLVVLGAGVSGSTASNGPLEVPVTVDVTANASAASVGLTVLAPQTSVGLGEDEAVRVNNGEDVEVVLVDEALDLGVGVVLGQEVEGQVLVDHGGDPLARVDGAVEDDSRLFALPGASPEVNTCDRSSLVGVARRDDGRAGWVGGLEIPQELEMVVVRMV